MNSVGVKTPPTAPEPKLEQVATTFSSMMTARLDQSHSSCRMPVTTL